jgi:hypothetical protein
MDAHIEQFPPYRKPDAHDHEDHGHAHFDPGFWAKYIFSTDHKVIGIQYGVTALGFADAADALANRASGDAGAVLREVAGTDFPAPGNP